MKVFYRLSSVDKYENNATAWVAGYKRTLLLDSILNTNMAYLLALGAVRHAQKRGLSPEELERDLYEVEIKIPRKRQPSSTRFVAAQRVLQSDDPKTVLKALESNEFQESKQFRIELAKVRHERAMARLEKD